MSLSDLRCAIKRMTPCSHVDRGVPCLPDWDSVMFALSQTDCFSDAVVHSLQRFQMWLAACGDVAAFKIGIAIDPTIDIYLDYMQGGQWHFMDVVFRGSVMASGDMEAALISLLKSIPGCYNIKPGREGINASSPATCHCYIVYAAAGHGIGLKRARQLAIV